MADNTRGTTNGQTHHEQDDLRLLLSKSIGQRRQPSAPEPIPAPPVESAAVEPVGSVVQMPDLTALPGTLPVGWDVIEDLQQEVSDQVTKRDPQRRLGDTDRRALTRSTATEVVAEWAALRAQEADALSREDEIAISHAVFDAIYRGGRLQRLMDDPNVTDIMIDGLTAHIAYNDGRPRATVHGVVDDEDELIAWVNQMAERSGLGERALSQADPTVSIRQPDGSRITASVLTDRPSVIIRRHTAKHAGLQQLIDWGTLDSITAHFLRACVEARMNILIAGDMGVGKTTLLRSLGRMIPRHEVLVTLEELRELYLDDPDIDAGPLTFAFEARYSNGERTQDNNRVGEITISDIFPVALRYNANRVIVGEVRTTEIKPMLQAMSAGGSGSMCTIHARRPHVPLARLQQLCTDTGMTSEAANHLIAASVDIIVYINKYRDAHGREHRFISHIEEIADMVGEGGQPTKTPLFQPKGRDPRAVYESMPSFIDDLETYGNFRRSWLTDNPHGQWKPWSEVVGAA